MAVQTPKSMVADKGGRAALVDGILPVLGSDDRTRSRLMGTTNKKLLRIHEVAKQVEASFGNKAGLLNEIEKLQFGGKPSNEGWRDKYETFTVKRLLDVHRQLASK